MFTTQLESGSTWVMTPFGKLSVQWTQSKGAVSVTLTIPVGVNATFSIPGRTASPVSVYFPITYGADRNGIADGLRVRDIHFQSLRGFVQLIKQNVIQKQASVWNESYVVVSNQ